MQEITQKLHKKVMDDFYPIAEQLAKEGKNKDEIVAIYQRQMNLKIHQYYNKKQSLISTKEIFGSILQKIDKGDANSKAEQIFYEMLIDNNIKFQFQFPIGQYKADYLFGGFLVVELDGAQHNKEHDDRRDKYMRSMGYKIIRVPIWVLVSCPDAVLQEIQEVLKEVGKTNA